MERILKGAVAKRKMLQPPDYAKKRGTKPKKEPFCGKTGDTDPKTSIYARLHVENYSVFNQLSRKFFEQLSAGTVVLNLVVKFVDVVTRRHEENFD